VEQKSVRSVREFGQKVTITGRGIYVQAPHLFKNLNFEK
jgi:hypothetical protein